MRQKLSEVAKRFADSSSDESSVDDSSRNSPFSASLSRHGPQHSVSRQSSASPAQSSASPARESFSSQSRQSASSPSPSSPYDIASAVSVEKGAKLCAGDSEGEEVMPPPHPRVLKSFDLEGLGEYIKTNCKNIIVMCGAGISVSAGIPDFRTPGTGLYDNLAKYNLPEPTAVFNINFFRGNPAPFYMLAKELFPGQYKPTPTHNFIRLLNDRGLLLRCFTQNIDSLEAEAGIPKEKIVAAHGNFDSATCIDTGQKVPVEEVRAAIMAGPEGYAAMNAKYGGLVKPDISFFGEKLPDRFYQLAGLDDPASRCQEDGGQCDFDKCDLLIVMGTSLVVQPFASLIDRVPETCPRVLFNRQAVAKYNPVLALMTGESTGFRFLDYSNYRDVCCLGNSDDCVKELARVLGWCSELDALVSGCGGWPARGPELVHLSEHPPPRKKISRKTVENAARVFQSILAGRGREGSRGSGSSSPVAATWGGGRGAQALGRLRQRSRDSLSRQSSASSEGRGSSGYRLSRKGGVSRSESTRSSQVVSSDDLGTSDEEEEEEGGESDEEEADEEAVQAQFRPLPRALEAYNGTPRILILEQPPPEGEEERGAGRRRVGAGGAGVAGEEDGGMLGAESKQVVATVVSRFAAVPNLLLLTGGRPGVEAYAGKVWRDERKRLGLSEASLLHLVPLSTFLSPLEDHFPEGFWGWGHGETVRCGANRQDSMRAACYHATLLLRVSAETGSLDWAHGKDTARVVSGDAVANGGSVCGVVSDEWASLSFTQRLNIAFQWISASSEG